jgi:DNA topoisomerase-3
VSTVVVAEKPSVARDLARVLGASSRGDGVLTGNGYVVTWAIGHLVGLEEPEGIDARWRRWSFDTLPMFPSRWPLRVFDSTRAQFEVVRRALSAKEVTDVICATDAGREGELIFRFIYEAAGCRSPVKRLWISSPTDGAIRDGRDKGFKAENRARAPASSPEFGPLPLHVTPRFFPASRNS